MGGSSLAYIINLALSGMVYMSYFVYLSLVKLGLI